MQTTTSSFGNAVVSISQVRVPNLGRVDPKAFFHKATEGINTGRTDDFTKRFIDFAAKFATTESDKMLGAYHVFIGGKISKKQERTPVLQAQHFLDTLTVVREKNPSYWQNRPIALAVFLATSTPLGCRITLKDLCDFIEIIQKRSAGVFPILYGNNTDFEMLTGMTPDKSQMDILSKCFLWIAHPGADRPTFPLSIWSEYTLWESAVKQAVPGICGDVSVVQTKFKDEHDLCQFWNRYKPTKLESAQAPSFFGLGPSLIQAQNALLDHFSSFTR